MCPDSLLTRLLPPFTLHDDDNFLHLAPTPPHARSIVYLVLDIIVKSLRSLSSTISHNASRYLRRRCHVPRRPCRGSDC